MTTTIAYADQDSRDRIERELDATLFVEAGAGTGKTRQLIERIVRLVASGTTELRHIAAITFTESAATELRDRVRMRLEEAAREPNLPDDERDRCSAALGQVDAAAIETLHAFAQRILSEHPLEAGLPPLVEIQDDIQASIAFEERWARFQEDLLDDPALEDVLLRAFALGLELGELRDAARQLHENWDRLDARPGDRPRMAAVYVGELIEELRDACGQRSSCTDHEDRLYVHLGNVERYCARLAAAGGDLDRLRVLSEPFRLRTQGGRGQDWGSVRPEDVRQQLRHADELRHDALRVARESALPALISAVCDFVLQYADERRRRGRLEFHDLLVQARNLLRRDPSVRRDVREQFTHLLIDEFQDTDPLQIEIAVLLASGDAEPPSSWRDAAIEHGRLFFVGDPKQSIYRFRRADIALYQSTRERFAANTVYLTQNFRSVRPVIDWLNNVFKQMMGADVSEGQAPYVPLAASWEAPKGQGTTVRILGSPRDGTIADIRAREAREIARVIIAAKAEGWPVVRADGGTREQDPARYADIALLMPTRTALPPIEEALEEAGIPYRVESRSLVYATQEVRDLLSILRALDDPTDEVALIAALRSPAFACGDDDLLRYKQAGGSWDFRSNPPDELPPDDPVVDAMTSLHDFHQRRWWEPISGVVEAVIRERRLFELGFAHRRPRERWQRLRFVLDQARAFAEAGGHTLRQFIEWADRQADEGTRVVETVVPEPDDDAVRVMTIHAAKGLEFPIVVLAGLNVEKGSQSRAEPALWHAEGRLEARVGRFETAGYGALSTLDEQLDEFERIRWLYVAATRARDHLIVSTYHRTGKESHAARILDLCTAAPELSRAVAIQPGLPLPDEREKLVFDDSAERREAWRLKRERLIQAIGSVPVVAATAIARGVGAAAKDPNLRKDIPVEEVPPWRRGRAGTAVGRAVHAVLQSIDLASESGVDGAARAQAAAEGIPNRTDDVARMVRAALRAPSVREAVAGPGRYWRELYVAAPVDGLTVEGFIDLLYETDDGLVIVDYKTDATPDSDDIDAALERYRLQGGAYALALEGALGRPVVRCVFLFVQPREPVERDVTDLRGTISEVRQQIEGRRAALEGAV